MQNELSRSGDIYHYLFSGAYSKHWFVRDNKPPFGDFGGRFFKERDLRCIDN